MAKPNSKHLIIGGDVEGEVVPEPASEKREPVDVLLETRKRIVLDEWFDRAGMVPIYDGPTLVKLLLTLVEQEARAWVRPRRRGNPGNRDMELILKFEDHRQKGSSIKAAARKILLRDDPKDPVIQRLEKKYRDHFKSCFQKNATR